MPDITAVSGRRPVDGLVQGKTIDKGRAGRCGYILASWPGMSVDMVSCS
jgi:hypothetical protein